MTAVCFRASYNQCECRNESPECNALLENYLSKARKNTLEYLWYLAIVIVTNTTAAFGVPPPPVNGFLQPHTNTTEGSAALFQCDPGFVPEGEMTAVCGRDGQWTLVSPAAPDPP